jgi:sortase A
MTVTVDPVAATPAGPADPGPAAGPPVASVPGPPVPPPVRPRYQPHLAIYLPGAMLSILAVLLLGLVANLALLSQLRYERTQQVAYADFRAELANATAPVSQRGVDGQLLEPGTAVAVLEIPAVGLRSVVFEGTSADVLMSGPGHRRDTVLPGQIGTSVIMGRQAAYGGPFGALWRLEAGDLITVTTGQGHNSFRVIGVRRPGDPVPLPAEVASGRLTLVTADGTRFLPTDLLRVDAELITPVQQTPARVFGARSLPPAEQALATDRQAWTPLVFWGQGLLLAALAVTWLRARWDRWQAWIVGVPVLIALGIPVADQVARLLPNLL